MAEYQNMQEFMAMYYRARTHDVRFTLPALAAARGRVNKTRSQRLEWARMVEACGAACIGKARVGPTGTHKDVVYSVPGGAWGTFVALLDAGPIVPVAEPHKQEPRLTLEQRVARLEAYVAGLASTDTP